MGNFLPTMTQVENENKEVLSKNMEELKNLAQELLDIDGNQFQALYSCISKEVKEFNNAREQNLAMVIRSIDEEMDLHSKETTTNMSNILKKVEKVEKDFVAMTSKISSEETQHIHAMKDEIHTLKADVRVVDLQTKLQEKVAEDEIRTLKNNMKNVESELNSKLQVMKTDCNAKEEIIVVKDRLKNVTDDLYDVEEELRSQKNELIDFEIALQSIKDDLKKSLDSEVNFKLQIKTDRIKAEMLKFVEDSMENVTDDLGEAREDLEQQESELNDFNTVLKNFKGELQDVKNEFRSVKGAINLGEDVMSELKNVKEELRVVKEKMRGANIERNEMVALQEEVMLNERNKVSSVKHDRREQEPKSSMKRSRASRDPTFKENKKLRKQSNHGHNKRGTGTAGPSTSVYASSTNSSDSDWSASSASRSLKLGSIKYSKSNSDSSDSYSKY